MLKIQSIAMFSCAILLAAVVLAIIFSSSFRTDILAGSGEARVFGILSVTGAVVIILVGLLLGGLLLSTKWMMGFHTTPKIRDIRNEGELLQALRLSYPNIPNEAWSIVEVSSEGEETAIQYLRVPLWFSEQLLSHN